VGESGKNKNKKERGIFHVFHQALPKADWHTVGLRVRLVDVINCAKFYCNRLRGSDSVRGRSLTIPIGLRCRL